MREPANRRLIIVVAAEPRPPALFTGPLGQGNNMKALTIHRARSPGVYGHLILVLTRSLHRSPGQAKRSPGSGWQTDQPWKVDREACRPSGA